MLSGILHYAHELLEGSINKGETVIDATCGNGNDTLFLSKIIGDSGHVLAFDIQNQAIINTKQLLDDHKCTNVTVIQDSHANIFNHVSANQEIGGAIFNLGYLPNSDKSVITKGESTLSAIHSILRHLKKNGLIVIVVYHGHQGGKQEKESLLEYLTSLNQKEFSVLKHEFINQKNNPPFVLAIQKR
ncbi:16S rRNA C1402 N4-methylase RsmH [Virgibacillus natechei]|uniref:16S rRNA C1402 N4-methylase RsmH n=1 Tax=Virgibacillus natechei TaxID=1216297 RepID=A0ABS4IF45_9BACI|nr:class I SAM-dependent methyltransferase [Virgibacillus natechei]MBP1969568.1 16S rRNA C1402 N4-methylase RsmH [Virgibacillus natechei]UZD11735.1 methyltransferase domain-containing protein [Virgibacillus natechei]